MRRRGRKALEGLQDDLRDHLARQTEENVGRGMTPEEARRQAFLALGNPTLIEEQTRAVWVWRWLDGLTQDVRYGLRTFRRDWVFALVALLTLTLGIGAATAMFSVVDAVALRPLPYGEPDTLVQIATGQGGQTSFEQYEAIVRETHTLADVATARLEVSAFEDPAGDQHIRDFTCTVNLFDLLGVRPQLGRAFAPSDADQPVIVLDHAWWMKQFGGDAAIIGRSVVLDGVRYDVIGVMPEDFRYPYKRSADAWIPADAQARADWARDGVWMTVARLRPSSSISAARAELAVISSRLAAADAQHYGHRPLTILPLLEAVVGVPVQTRLFVLLAAVACVLLIACVNVASLLLTRSHARSRELAVRAAMGADRPRLVRQLLTETVLMGLAGGAAGVGLARGVLAAIIGLIPSSIPRIGSIHIDGTVFLFALIVSLASGTGCGLMPAWRLSRTELHDALKDGSPTAAPAGAARLGGLFIFAETALALVLLIGAGLMIHSFDVLLHVDPGLDASGLFTITVLLSGPQPPAQIHDLLQRTRSLHGVAEASGADLAPFSGFTTSAPLQVRGRPDVTNDPSNIANLERVLPGYFRMAGISVVRGRDFSDRDVRGAPLVALINEAAVKKYFPTEDPLGLRIYGEDGWYQIVGIAKDVKWRSLADDAPPAMYFPLLQASTWPQLSYRALDLLVRVDPGTPVSLQELRREAATMMGGASGVVQVQSMEALVGSSVQQWKFQAVLLGLFGALALIIAVVGIFGVTSYAVVQRTREIGVRLALGAQRSDMLRMIVGGTTRPVIAGLIAGLFGAALATHTLAAFLFQIKPTDVPTYVVTTALFLGVALLASAIPAYRATRVDPVVTLRQD